MQTSICQSKKKNFASEKAALQYLEFCKTQSTRHGRIPLKLYPYKCSKCPLWHLTSKIKFSKQKERPKKDPFAQLKQHKLEDQKKREERRLKHEFFLSLRGEKGTRFMLNHRLIKLLKTRITKLENFP